MEMGYREYARHRGVTLGAVQKAIRDKRISVNGNGKIDAEIADREWTANTDASRVAVNVLDAKQATAPTVQMRLADAPAHADDDEEERGHSEEVAGTDRAANEYREHRATRERYQALKQQLEYEQLVGKMIDVDEAKRIAYTSFRSLRDAIMNVAPRLKDQLAAIDDPIMVEQLLESELTAALAGIDIGKILKDQEE